MPTCRICGIAYPDEESHLCAPKVSVARVFTALVSLAGGSYLGFNLGIVIACDWMVSAFPGHECIKGGMIGLLIGGAVMTGLFAQFVGIREPAAAILQDSQNQPP